MTALSVFLIVMTISMGSILSVFDADRKAKSMRAIMGNLNLAMETMAREMRFGQNYHCGGGDPALPQNCPSGDISVSFLSSEGVQIHYRKLASGTTIEKSVAGQGFVPVTAPEVTIENLTFYVLGAGEDNALQPKILIVVKGQTGTGVGQTDFNLQTLVSQRELDR